MNLPNPTLPPTARAVSETSYLPFWSHVALVDACARWAGFDVVFPGDLTVKDLTVVKVMPERAAIEG